MEEMSLLEQVVDSLLHLRDFEGLALRNQVAAFLYLLQGNDIVRSEIHCFVIVLFCHLSGVTSSP